MKKTIFALLIISAAVSCKKSDSTPTCPATAATLSGTYKVAAIKYKASSASAEADLFSSKSACEKDDTYNLNADGSFEINDAGMSCGLPPSPGSETWSLSSNNTMLNWAASTAAITSFDCTTLVVTESDVNAPGDKQITTLTKQ